MPAVQMVGHAHEYPVSDVLRLFYGPRLRTVENVVTAGDDLLLIYSSMDPVADNQVRITTEWVSEDRQWRKSRAVAVAQAKREIKRQLYQGLVEWTGLQFPWGSLTGIRPTQVASESIRKCGSPDEARRDLVNTWFVSPEKADLAVETAIAEDRLLAGIPDSGVMVYLGIPFCPSRCAYCSFITEDAVHKTNLLAPYVEAVLDEAATIFSQLGDALPVTSVYVGGGTPTSLPPGLFGRLIEGVFSRLPLAPDAELTVEAGRPDTICPEKLAIIRDLGVGRLCINPQTFHDATLVRIGRRHSTSQTVDAFQLARSMGFESINMDLIAGLPGETPEDFLDSLRQALVLGPESITLHSLAMKRSSRLNRRSRDLMENPGMPDPGLAAGLAAGRRRLAESGLFPYYLYRQKDVKGGLENTGFARPGHENLYNVGMMSDHRPVIGLGSGAMSKIISGSRVKRSPNPRDIADYIRRTAELAKRKIALFKSDAT